MCLPGDLQNVDLTALLSCFDYILNGELADLEVDLCFRSVFLGTLSAPEVPLFISVFLLVYSCRKIKLLF